RRHTRFSRDWSSDVCSSDLESSGGVRVVQDKVVVTRLLPREGLRELEDFCSLVLNESLTPFSPEQWRRHLQDATAVLCVSQRFRSEERRVGGEWRWRGAQR